MRISDWSSDVCSSDLLISAKPDLGGFSGSIKGEVGNYDSRRMTAMLNVPLIDDILGVRVAGSMTDRDGYDYNSVTKNRINGRDLWSLRTTIAFEPDRKSVVWGKSVSVRVDIGGSRIIQKKKHISKSIAKMH